MEMTGAPSKYSEKDAALIVAEDIIRCRSGRMRSSFWDDGNAAVFFQKAKDEVYVKAPFVRFVHHYYAVGRQQGVIFEFFEKNSVRHDLDACIGIRGVMEPHLAGGIRIVFTGLLADELGDSKCGYTPRLGDSHHP